MAAAPLPACARGLLDTEGRELAPALTVLLIPNEPEESTAFFRFQVMKTPDPRDVYERALAFLQADYFQKPETFSDRLVTVLPRDAALAAALLDEGACVLEFVQSRQSYRIAAEVRALKSGHAAREAAIWHNRLFNPALPDNVHVLESPGQTGSRPEPIQRPPAERHAPSRTCDTPCSAASEDDAAKFGNARAARAPACRDPADCRATSSTSECAPSH